MKISFGYLIPLFFLISLSFNAEGQKNAQLHWYFSENNNGIFFDQNTLQPRLETLPNTLNSGQSGVVSDLVTGELVFYTDGQLVYDKFHRIVSNGAGLLANPAGPQAVAVSAVPGNTGQFYIFTNSANLTTGGNLRYSVYDTAAYGAGGFPEPPAGDIADKNLSIAGVPDGTLSPAMVVISNATYDGFWLITHQRNSENYRVTSILPDGTFGATTGFIIPGAPEIAHTISYTDSTHLYDSSLLTLSIAPQDNRPVTLVSFDTSTGTIDVTDPQYVPNTSTSQMTNQNIYDTEFSPNGRYLYISGNFDSTADSLMQVDLTNPTFPMASLSTVNAMVRSYGLQRGPDNNIYHLFETNTITLGRINDPDSVASDAFYSRTAIGNNAFVSEQFPAFQPLIRPQLELSFEVAGSCANTPIIFLPTIKPAADSVLWDFGDGSFSTSYSPRHTYSQGGAISVTLRAFTNGLETDTTRTINIQEFDLTISGFPQDTIVCSFPIQLTAEGQGNDATGATYRWSNSDTDGPTTTIDSAGNYYVVATAPSGCSAYQSVRAQEFGVLEQRGFVWYFGEHAGIDFNPIVDGGQPVPIPYGDPTIYDGGNEMVAPEGTAIYCDPNGYPIFYSDGMSVYDREGTLVATLTGDPDATQSVMIMEYPGDATLYYIFTTQEIYNPNGGNTYELHYSIFDIKLRNGLGDILRDQSNQIVDEVLMTSSTERLTGNQQWLIAHEYGNNIFRAFRLGGDGIQTPVISQIGSVHTAAEASAGHGYMRLSAMNTLAVALPMDGNNYIEVFDFVDSIGAITNFRQINVNDDFNVNGNLYGLEFSSNGSKIYGSLNGGSESYIVEYWLDSLSNPVPQPDPPFSSSLTLGALQISVDGSIYVAVDGQPFLGNIQTTPDTSFVSQFQEHFFDLAPGTKSLLGLPNFINQYGSGGTGPSVLGTDGCPGEDLLFEATGWTTFDNYTWNIYDSTGQRIEGPFPDGPGQTSQYTFSSVNPGSYEARVTFSVCDTTTTITRPFTIFAPPAIGLSAIDASACGAFDGQLDITMNFPGFYHYTIRNTDGQILDAGFDVNNPNLVLSDLPGGIYTVFVEEQTNGCSNQENITIQEDPPFAIDDFNTGRADCDGENGEIFFSVDVNATPPLTYTVYEQTIGTSIGSGSFNGGDTTIVALPAGMYYLEVTDLNNCSAFLNDLEILRPDTATLLTDLFVAACNVTEIKIGAQTPDGMGIEWTYGNNSFTGDSLDVFPPGGIYTVTAFGDDINNCDNSKNVSVIFNESSPNPFREQYTICPQDPILANAVVGLYPGNEFPEVQYYDEDGVQIDQNTPGFEFSGDTLYVFTLANITAVLTNSFGCETIAEISVLESCKARITVPNAFRPSSAVETNKSFRIFSTFLDPDNFQIFIFNRWGEVVFESNDPNFRWNGGKLNNINEPLLQGTYAYVIRYISRFEPQLGVQIERGGVVLLR